MVRILLIAGTAGILAACNSGSSRESSLTLPTPSAPQIVYSGTITDSVGGAGSLTITLGNSGSQIGGTWVASYPEQSSRTRFVSGTVSGTNLTATVSDCLETDSQLCFPDCRQTLTGTLTSGAMSGTYAEVANDSCAAHSGAVSANRR
jgi:hypothetical protein